MEQTWALPESAAWRADSGRDEPVDLDSARFEMFRLEQSGLFPMAAAEIQFGQQELPDAQAAELVRVYRQDEALAWLGVV